MNNSVDGLQLKHIVCRAYQVHIKSSLDSKNFLYQAWCNFSSYFLMSGLLLSAAGTSDSQTYNLRYLANRLSLDFYS